MTEFTDIYRTREWFESLNWQHMWIDAMVGWWIGEFGRPDNMMDFGAGDGWWSYAFLKMGVSAAALELDAIAKEFIPEGVGVVIQDLRKPFNVGGYYELLLCLEVGEHIPKEDVEIFCKNIADHTWRHLLFSAAMPGQPGTGHINLQTPEYWASKFMQWRLVPNIPVTTKCRDAFRNILPPQYDFLTKNVRVYTKQ